MARKRLTDAEVEQEIKRLKESPMVALGQGRGTDPLPQTTVYVLPAAVREARYGA